MFPEIVNALAEDARRRAERHLAAIAVAALARATSGQEPVDDRCG